VISAFQDFVLLLQRAGVASTKQQKKKDGGSNTAEKNYDTKQASCVSPPTPGPPIVYAHPVAPLKHNDGKQKRIKEPSGEIHINPRLKKETPLSLSL